MSFLIALNGYYTQNAQSIRAPTSGIIQGLLANFFVIVILPFNEKFFIFNPSSPFNQNIRYQIYSKLTRHPQNRLTLLHVSTHVGALKSEEIGLKMNII